MPLRTSLPYENPVCVPASWQFRALQEPLLAAQRQRKRRCGGEEAVSAAATAGVLADVSAALAAVLVVTAVVLAAVLVATQGCWR